jgi:hypothetical protein
MQVAVEATFRTHPIAMKTMTPHRISGRSPAWTLSLCAAACLLASTAQAQGEAPADLDQVQATTQALIDTLVQSGVISREKAEQLTATARAKAQAQRAAAAPQQSPSPEVGKDGKRVVRVPYVSETTKAEVREQIKQEVLAQARQERWGEPGALPSWLNRFEFSGDMRLRQEFIRLAPGNTPAGTDYVNGNLTRAADLLAASSGKASSANTQSDYDRQRVRARLGISAHINQQVDAGLRLSTGNTTDRTSTNQTLGQNFNKYTLVLDQGYLSLRPGSLPGLQLSGGRIANPFFSTDLVWADDLGFEGVAARYRADAFGAHKAFFSAGWFPITPGNPGSSRSRSLLGLQAGMEGALGRGEDRYKIGLSLYNYRGLAGQKETDAAYLSRPDYLTRYEYAQGLRQRGNTLFRLNAPSDTSNNNYGLASEFRELNLTVMAEFPRLLPVPITLTADFVKNLQFDRADIRARTGEDLLDGKGTGFMLKAQIGQTQTLKPGDWSAWLAYRYVGSDAVLDAFTNSDFGLGGTNNKGFVLGASYALYDNTWLTLRWMSSDVIDPMAPGASTPTKLSVDTIQLDLNARF